MRTVYLDNSATTPICESALKRMEAALRMPGNPSSLHFEGLRAREVVVGARAMLLKALGIRSAPDPAFRAIFTSCGSESNNLALCGTLNARVRKFIPRVITTDSEHPSVLLTLEKLEKEGKVEVVRLSTKGGAADERELALALNERTVLVSIMAVNNETGAVYDINRLFGIVKRADKNIITHTDLTQGFLKIDIPGGYAGQNTDLITISGHKIHAPKGIAALIVRSELIKKGRLSPLLTGGGQEDGMRSGTENLPGIAALHGALEEGLSALGAGLEEKTSSLRESFISSLPDEIKVNSPQRVAPHIISVTLPGIKSQTMLSFLSERGICVSSGSACSSRKGALSYVLKAYGLTDKEADCTLRISMSDQTTEEELEIASAALADGLRTLARF